MWLPHVSDQRPRQIAALIAVVAGASALFTLACLAPRLTASSSPKEVRNPTEVIVWMYLMMDRVDVGVRIRDKEAIREMVETPLGNAKRDPQPARYVVLGTLTTIMDDGSEDRVTLFLPWGRVKRGNEYLIADLDKLHKLFDERIKLAARHLDENQPPPTSRE